jgi:hypothetical protein
MRLSQKLPCDQMQIFIAMQTVMIVLITELSLRI